MIFTNDISDQHWDLKGYEGLQNIGEQYGVDVYYEENVTNQHEIIDVVDDFVRKGTNLIFGHGHIYGRTFVDRKSTRLNSSHVAISYAVFCLKKKTRLDHTKL